MKIINKYIKQKGELIMNHLQNVKSLAVAASLLAAAFVAGFGINSSFMYFKKDFTNETNIKLDQILVKFDEINTKTINIEERLTSLELEINQTKWDKAISFLNKAILHGYNDKNSKQELFLFLEDNPSNKNNLKLACKIDYIYNSLIFSYGDLAKNMCLVVND